VKKIEKKDPNVNIPNLWCKNNGEIVKNGVRDLVEDLDSLPFPDRDLFADKPLFIRTQYGILTSRGCLFSCSYCCNSVLRHIYNGRGKYCRLRSVDNVMSELHYAKSKYGVKKFMFVDEELFIDPDRTRILLERYKEEIDLPFWCFANPNVLDEEKIVLLEKTGCSEVDLGVQEIDRRLNESIMGRSVDVKRLKGILTGFRKSKVVASIDVMLGLPTQTADNLLDMVRFFSDFRVDIFCLNWLRYYPATRIIEHARCLLGMTEDEVKKMVVSSSCFTAKGSTFDRELARISNYFYMTALLPGKMIKFMLKVNAHRFFPPFLMRRLFMSLLGIRLLFLKVIGVKRRRLLFTNIEFEYAGWMVKWIKYLFF